MLTLNRAQGSSWTKTAAAQAFRGGVARESIGGFRERRDEDSQQRNTRDEASDPFGCDRRHQAQVHFFGSR